VEDDYGAVHTVFVADKLPSRSLRSETQIKKIQSSNTPTGSETTRMQAWNKKADHSGFSVDAGASALDTG